MVYSCISTVLVSFQLLNQLKCFGQAGPAEESQIQRCIAENFDIELHRNVYKPKPMLLYHIENIRFERNSADMLLRKRARLFRYNHIQWLPIRFDHVEADIRNNPQTHAPIATRLRIEASPSGKWN